MSVINWVKISNFQYLHYFLFNHHYFLSLHILGPIVTQKYSYFSCDTLGSWHFVDKSFWGTSLCFTLALVLLHEMKELFILVEIYEYETCMSFIIRDIKFFNFLDQSSKLCHNVKIYPIATKIYSHNQGPLKYKLTSFGEEMIIFIFFKNFIYSYLGQFPINQYETKTLH